MSLVVQFVTDGISPYLHACSLDDPRLVLLTTPPVPFAASDASLAAASISLAAAASAAASLSLLLPPAETAKRLRLLPTQRTST